MTNRSRILAFGFAGFLVILGVAGAIAFTTTAGQVAALVFVGIGFVLATSLVFLEVGLSEDRKRAREDAKRQKTERAKERRGRPRLDRMRGHSQRLK